MFCKVKKSIKEYREWQLKFYTRAEDRETAEDELYKLSDLLLANTVVEDWSYELTETEETGIGNISNSNAGTSKHHLFE